MEYSKKILDDYLEKITKERFSTEIAIINNERHLEKVESERKGLVKRLKKIGSSLKDLELQKKEGIRDRELKEQNKTLITVLRDDIGKRNQKLDELEGRKKQIEKNLELYKDYIETIDSSIEIAKDKVSV